MDICNADEDENGRLPYNVQCKTLAKAAPYPKLLAELEEHNGRKQINVVLHKQTENVNGRFLPRGEYAILNADDFYRMVESILHMEKLMVAPNSSSDSDTVDFIINRINKQL
ncbi:hypothetical protein [Tenacibaculum sp.]|uniref:hypothetical protein n=1 Tax=Tenacibaculum sp. TaxID=1906242 RepID=UPI003D130E48